MNEGKTLSLSPPSRETRSASAPSNPQGENTERRIHPRRQVTDGRGLLRVRTKVEVLNLSLTGAAIATTERLALGGSYRLLLDQGSRRIDLQATVVRSTLRSTRTGTAPAELVYKTALELQGMLQEGGEEMAELLAEQALAEFGGRICDRFSPPAGLQAEIEREEDVELRSISPSGLAVETTADLEPGREVAVSVRMDRTGRDVAVAGRIVYRLPVAPERYRLGIESAAVHPE
jgi:hypothetical protein